MDINNVNLNKVYSLVSAAGNEQVLNVSEDLKTLSLAESNPNPTKEQVETNRKFHDGLLSSLQEITNDETVLKEVRSKLGLSEGSEKVEPKSIFARDIKSAIDLVMSKVSKRIGEVLTRPFPPAVNELILEAVKANPKHDVVKAFLKEEGGTLDNLARLCRLTCQSLQDGANSAALAYLDGFAYDVADFENVHRTSEEYDVGLNHRKEEEKAQKSQEKADEKERVIKEDNNKENKNEPVVNKDNRNEAIQPVIQEVKVKQETSEKVEKLKNEILQLYGVNAGKVKSDFMSFVEKYGDSWVDNFIGGCQGSVGFDENLVKEEERFSILAREINKKWASVGQSVQDVGKAYGDAVQNAITRYEQVFRFRMAVSDIKTTLDAKAQEVKNEGALLVKSAKEGLLKEINDLVLLDTEGGEIFDSMNTVLKNTDDKDLKEALKQKLTEILDQGLENFKVSGQDDKQPDRLQIIYKESEIQGVNKNKVKLSQQRTNLCYVRCLENGLIGSDQVNKLPTPTKVNAGLISKGKDQYTFRVDVGGAKTAKVDLTVTKSEIEAIKEWYDANWRRYNADHGEAKNYSHQVPYGEKSKKWEAFKFYGAHKEMFTDLDWAINIGMAKRAMWKDAQRKSSGKVVDAPKPFAITGSTFSLAQVTGGYAGKNCEEYLKNQLITQMGHDTEVAEFLGLKQDENLSVNHNITKEAELEKGDKAEQPSDLELFKRWSKVRQWKQKHPDGIMTLHVAGKHYVTVQDCYYKKDNDFGFIVRDSNDNVASEKKINVIGYGAEVKDDKTYCNTLQIHCFLPNA